MTFIRTTTNHSKPDTKKLGESWLGIGTNTSYPEAYQLSSFRHIRMRRCHVPGDTKGRHSFDEEIRRPHSRTSFTKTFCKFSCKCISPAASIAPRSQWNSILRWPQCTTTAGCERSEDCTALESFEASSSNMWVQMRGCLRVRRGLYSNIKSRRRSAACISCRAKSQSPTWWRSLWTFKCRAPWASRHIHAGQVQGDLIENLALPWSICPFHFRIEALAM